MDLKDVSIVIPGECYQRLITHLTNHFTYAQIFQVIKDLEDNAFQVGNEVVVAYDPRLQEKNILTFPSVNGLKEAREIDENEMHLNELIDDSK